MYEATMSHHGPASSHSLMDDPELLLRTLAFALIAAGAIIVLVGTDSRWTTALALGGLTLAIAGAMLSGAAVLRNDDADANPAPGRGRIVALGLLAVAVIVLAAVVG
jgi:hypothetical protein